MARIFRIGTQDSRVKGELALLAGEKKRIMAEYGSGVRIA